MCSVDASRSVKILPWRKIPVDQKKIKNLRPTNLTRSNPSILTFDVPPLDNRWEHLRAWPGFTLEQCDWHHCGLFNMHSQSRVTKFETLECTKNSGIFPCPEATGGRILDIKPWHLCLYCQSLHDPILKSSAVLPAMRVIIGAKRQTSRANATRNSMK